MRQWRRIRGKQEKEVFINPWFVGSGQAGLEGLEGKALRSHRNSGANPPNPPRKTFRVVSRDEQ